MPFQRELKKVNEILSQWKGNESLWLHIIGEDGSAREALLRLISQKHLSGHRFLFEYDFQAFPYKSGMHARQLLHFILESHREEFQDFLSSFPGRLEYLTLRALQGETGQESSFASEDSWEYNLLRQFMRFLGRKGPLVILLENAFSVSSEQMQLLFKVLKFSRDLPLILLTTGERDADNAFGSAAEYHLSIGKRSVRETEKLVRQHLQTSEINTRLITNQLYIKSEGNIRKIGFMAEAFYRTLLNEDGDLLATLDIHRNRVSGALNDIFNGLAEQLPDGLMDIFSLLSRLEDPLPKPLFLSILKAYDYGKRDYKQWRNQGWISEKKCLQDEYVLLDWEPWRNFLRNHTSIERSRVVLAVLKKKIGRFDLQLPLELSCHFFDIGDFSAALELAYLEAKSFERFGENQRALERYAFLKRNLPRFPDSDISYPAVLKGLGLRQKQIGLYENAFESFREIRESLHREDREEWVMISLEMADTLFQMDALSEALYHIKEIKIKDAISFSAYAFSNILMGELEQNFGHPEYALRYYEKALSILPKVTDEALISRLFGILKKIYSGSGDRAKYVQSLEQINRNLAVDVRLKPIVQLELIKQHISGNNYQAALNHAIAVYRKSRAVITPRMAARIRLYLAEIYGYYGKWYLSRSYLRRLLNSGVLISNLRIRVRVMTDLGIVEKELGHYGAAQNLFESALEIAREHHLTEQRYLCKIHLGHIFLLVHSFMRAREHLVSALQWAQNNQDEEMVILSTLLLSTYELQQEKPTAALKYLEQAKGLVNLLNNPIDHLNYQFYRTMYELQCGNVDKALAISGQLEEQAAGISKFENLSFWLSGKVHLAAGNYKAAAEKLQTAMKRSRTYRLPYLAFQVLRDMTILAEKQQDVQKYQYYSDLTMNAFQELLLGIDDEIMQRQMEESREFEAFIRIGG